MPKGPKQPGPATSGGNEPESALHCGDCRSLLGIAARTADKSAAKAADYYCPLCVQAVSDPIDCDHCGSTICPRCGTPLELADELGVG